MKMGRPSKLFFFLLYLSRLTEEASVTYNLREEQSSGTFVGNIERDMLLRKELNPQDVFNLKYTLSTAGNPRAHLFSVNETSSTVSTAQIIDREEVCPGQAECQITLSIAVYRRGVSLDLFKLWEVVVNINDTNDNSPTFPQPFVSLSVPESVPPMHVLHTSGAEDRDKGENNSVQSYRLSPPDSLFDLNVVDNPDGSSDLGIVIKRQLDREEKEFYQLKVVVTDGGHPQRTGSLTINITVTDINDERPTFAKSTYNVTVQENTATGVPILQVSATDKDIRTNGEVVYSFSPQTPEEIKSRLQIDANTGIVSARGPIDYEEKHRYQFLVEAKDKGSPQLSGGTVVTVNVEDVNDNAPQININLTPGGNNLTEDEAVGKFIAHVSVSDGDSGQNSVVICSMDDDHFSLQKFYDHAYNMYKVLLSSALDYETSTSHRVTITCRDRGQPVLANSTAFTVYVRDVNDNAPVFSQQTYTGSILENKLDVEEVLQVEAHDYDTGPAGQVDYALDSSPNISRIFSLDPRTGVLRVKSPLNREDRGQYVFHVLAYDKGSPRQTSSAIIVITVEDENDEKPYFTRSLFDCYILEEQEAGTRVGNLSAIDGDSTQHSQNHFSIVPGVGDYQLFAIEASTGVLKSKARFDREEKQLYKFMVKVEDPTFPRFYDLANVTVHVLDDNDNPPVIQHPREGNNSINITYGLPVGSMLTNIKASDKDDGIFGTLSFFIALGDPSHLFHLNERNGSLRLARTILPSDVQQQHVLDIRVQDGGNPPLLRDVEFYVHIALGNVTLAEPSAGENQNMVIVIILVCVTVALALAVLITICLIRHIDNEKRARRRASKAEEEKMFHLKNQETFLNPSPDTSTGSSDSSGSSSSSNGGKNQRKEVSFSLEERANSLNMSSGSAANNMSTFKTPLSRLQEVTFPENRLSVNCPPLRNETGLLSGGPLSHVMCADDNQLHAVQEEEGCQYMEMLKRNGEDALSESSGETGTSDSGRGGSEDDSHSNRGSAMIDPDGPAVYPNVCLRGTVPSYPGMDAPSARGRHYGARSRFTSDSSPSGRPLRQHSPHVSFSGNLHYLGETSTDCDAEFPPPPPPDLVHDPPPPTAVGEKNFSTFGSPLSNSYRSVLHSHPGNHGYAGVSTSLVRNSSPSPPLQVEAGGRQVWRSPSFNDDDDRTNSTTSGSYVINPDDLRKEIDDLILNDMIV